MSVNKAILVGRLRHPPSLKETNGGTSICKFSLATDHNQKNGDEWEKATTWHNVICFGRTAENCKQYLDKGSAVFIEGRIDNGKYEKDGETKYYSQVVAESVKFLSRKDELSQTIDNDNIPF